jgi:predicted NBD/HSP70 family sugar kinase
MRRHNLALVLRAIVERGPVSRAAVAAYVGLTKATVSSIVEELLVAGFVAEVGRENRGEAGRPGTVLAANPNGPVGVGLEINVDYIAVCLVDLAGEVRRVDVRRGDNRELPRGDVLRIAAELVATTLVNARTAGLKPLGLAVALPGLVDEPSGMLIVAPNLGWRDLDVPGALRAAGLSAAAAELPIAVGNEANFAAIGELWYGHGPELGDFVHVTGETGIGAGLVVGRRLFGGAHGYAGELGHVTVEPDGPGCGCGARGCLEAYAGQEVLARAAGLSGVTGTSVGNPDGLGALIEAAAAAGQPEVLAALRRAGWALGVALTDVVHLLDPDAVVLAGLCARLAAWLVPELRAQLTARTIGGVPPRTRVEVSQLGPYGALRGAAGSVVMTLLANPMAEVA